MTCQRLLRLPSRGVARAVMVCILLGSTIAARALANPATAGAGPAISFPHNVARNLEPLRGVVKGVR